MVLFAKPTRMAERERETGGTMPNKLFPRF